MGGCAEPIRREHYNIIMTSKITTRTATDWAEKREKTSQSQALGVLATFILIVVIIFSLPTLVGGAPANTFCSGHGYITAQYSACVCMDSYYGFNCQFRRCPFGSAWISAPTTDNIRSLPQVECSNMGYCDSNLGVCACRSGYEGRACERCK